MLFGASKTQRERCLFIHFITTIPHCVELIGHIFMRKPHLKHFVLLQCNTVHHVRHMTER